MCEDDIEARCASHAHVASDARFASGEVFGDWRITVFIGRGGSGEVYCAEHVTLGTPAAVKVLVRDDERAKARFVGEARLVAKLRSDAFPRFFAYGEANGAAYLAMELLEPGESKVMSFPCGRYTLKVAKGPKWISDEEAFGSAGSYSTTDFFTFEEGEAYQISSGERGDFHHDDSGGFLG